MDQLCVETYRDQDVLVYDGCRLVVPSHRRGAILSLLHAGHSGIVKTYKTATQLYYWPSMKTDIEQSVANCSPCQAQRQSNPRPKMDTVNLPGNAKQPMYVCMYVCMYRGRPSWICPWDRAFQLGQGEGPIRIVGPISQPRGIIDTASLTPDRTRALVYAFWADFNLGS